MTPALVGTRVRAVATPWSRLLQMKPVLIAGALALALALAACGRGTNTQSSPSAAAADTIATATTYSAAGSVTGIAGDRVTISHGPVAGLGWPAMTMTFRAGDPAMLHGVSVGDRVAFQFRQDGTDYPLTVLSKAR
jgi:Cu/Ag efflux protein CusF